MTEIWCETDPSIRVGTACYAVTVRANSRPEGVRLTLTAHVPYSATVEVYEAPPFENAPALAIKFIYGAPSVMFTASAEPASIKTEVVEHRLV